MRAAGASVTEFPAAAGHWQYAERAVRNAENGTAAFLGEAAQPRHFKYAEV
jgi:hypothetical protein